MPKNKTEQPKNKKKQDEDDDEDEDADEDEDEEEVEETEDEEEVEEDEDEDEKPAKAKKGGKGGGKGSGLVPREPVTVPKDVLKAQPKEIQALLKQRDALQAAGDKKGLRKIRMQLRSKGFKLSELAGK
jgi:hypothetical protein